MLGFWMSIAIRPPTSSSSSSIATMRSWHEFLLIALIYTIYRMLSHCAVGLSEKAKTGVWMISESVPVRASNKARQKVCSLTISRCWEGGQSRTVLQVRYIRVREGEGEEQLSRGRVRRGGSKLILIAPLDRTLSCISRTLACTDLWHVKGTPQLCVKNKERILISCGRYSSYKMCHKYC